MKIYFAASSTGREKFQKNYELIVKHLRAFGYDVKEFTLSSAIQSPQKLSETEKVQYYKKVIDAINSVDVVVTEVSQPSISIGHEITIALEKGKPVVVLYTGENEPYLLQGLVNDKILIQNYDFDDLKSVLEDSIKDASEQMDVRFNFFVSPKIVSYLDWIAKRKKMPRAVYLRRLIESDMDKNKDFLKGE